MLCSGKLPLEFHELILFHAFADAATYEIA